jgi:hypothetical protein
VVLAHSSADTTRPESPALLDGHSCAIGCRVPSAVTPDPAPSPVSPSRRVRRSRNQRRMNAPVARIACLGQRYPDRSDIRLRSTPRPCARPTRPRWARCAASSPSPRPGGRSAGQGQVAQRRDAQDPPRARLLLMPPGRRSMPLRRHLRELRQLRARGRRRPGPARSPTASKPWLQPSAMLSRNPWTPPVPPQSEPRPVNRYASLRCDNSGI